MEITTVIPLSNLIAVQDRNNEKGFFLRVEGCPRLHPFVEEVFLLHYQRMINKRIRESGGLNEICMEVIHLGIREQLDMVEMVWAERELN